MEGILHVAYRLCPYRVLRCDANNGLCVDAEMAVNQQKVKGCNPAMSGSGQMSALNSSLLFGVAHSTTHLRASQRWAWGVGIDRHYEHRFYAAAARPPFRLLGLSDPFHFPRFFLSELDLVQFCGGISIGMASSSSNTTDAAPLAVQNSLSSQQSVTVGYGAGDCAALSVSLPVPDVLRLTLGSAGSTLAPHKLNSAMMHEQ